MHSQELRKQILADIAADPSISVRTISLDVSRTGFLKKKRALKVSGTVTNGAQKDRVLRLAQERAGADYEILDHLFVSELLWEG